MWAVSCEKIPYVLSRCHTKRRTDARGRARPSFGMTPTFQKKNQKFSLGTFSRNAAHVSGENKGTASLSIHQMRCVEIYRWGGGLFLHRNQLLLYPITSLGSVHYLHEGVGKLELGRGKFVIGNANSPLAFYSAKTLYRGISWKPAKN